MFDVTNSDRADWAMTAVQAFRDECRGSPLDSPDGIQEAIGDLICNLLHLARERCGITDVAAYAQGCAETCLDEISDEEDEEFEDEEFEDEEYQESEDEES